MIKRVKYLSEYGRKELTKDKVYDVIKAALIPSLIDNTLDPITIVYIINDINEERGYYMGNRVKDFFKDVTSEIRNEVINDILS